MHKLRISLLSGVVFAKESSGLLGGGKNPPAAGETTLPDPADGPTPAEKAAQQGVDVTSPENSPEGQTEETPTPDPLGGTNAITKGDAEARQEGLAKATGLTVEQAMVTDQAIANIQANTTPQPGGPALKEPPGGSLDPETAYPKDRTVARTRDDSNPFGSSSRMEAPLSFNVDASPEDDLEFTDDGLIRPYAAYKHRNVMRFQVGKFIFQDHILLIYNEADNNEFLALAKDLTPQDRTAIVHYNWQAAANVEKPVNYDSVSRGAVSTGKTKDPKVVQ